VYNNIVVDIDYIVIE